MAVEAYRARRVEVLDPKISGFQVEVQPAIKVPSATRANFSSSSLTFIVLCPLDYIYMCITCLVI